MTPTPEQAALEALNKIQEAASGFSSPAYAAWVPYLDTIRRALASQGEREVPAKELAELFFSKSMSKFTLENLIAQKYKITRKEPT